MWQEIQVDLEANVDIFVFAATRGGSSIDDDEGDICIDDVNVQYGKCCKSTCTYSAKSS